VDPRRADRVEFTTARSDGEAAYADRAMDGVKFDRENYGLRFTRTALTPLVAERRSAGFSTTTSTT
jgi:iron complex outermembrane receptor protein